MHMQFVVEINKNIDKPKLFVLNIHDPFIQK